MKFSSAAVPTLAVLGTSASVGAKTTSHPGLVDLDPRFRAHLNCPYADQWLAKGPEQAARELGLDHEEHRKLEENAKQRKLADAVVQGSCTFPAAWGGGTTCMQFNGAGWNDDSMTTRCANENGSSFSNVGCEGVDAGWCMKTIEDDKHEATAMMISPMADCDGSKMACSNFMGGTFMAAGDCAISASEETGESNIFGSTGGQPPAGVSAEPQKCLIAPGAIGAAHQLGFSKGYSNSCPGTPAQESPYMWPMKWAADYENQAMVYGNDAPVYNSRGRTFYMLDKNWKRSDTTHQEGVLRAIVTGGPCEEVEMDDSGVSGCAKNQTAAMWTVLHLENEMYFVDWKSDVEVSPGETDASKVANCTFLDMAVVGNIRPDWFMDKRGDDTDVQYLGDQHVYYDAKVPKLVKQWRKKDFASQYFTMSVMGNPPNKLTQDPEASVEENTHWPLILNIPGEGFGDDSLQRYSNHALLSEEDEDLFTLIANFKAMGGVCANGRGGGAPVGEGEEGGAERPHVPSNLEVDPQSWMSNEITFSPIWEVPTKDASDSSMTASTSGKAVLEVSSRITVESCYDAASGMMDMSVHFKDVAPTADGKLPWMAVGYRPDEACRMLPEDGSSTPLVLVTQSAEDAQPMAHKTELLAGTKSKDMSILGQVYAGMSPLENEEDYMMVSVEDVSDDEDRVTLHFKQDVGHDPENLNMLFAIGMGSELGFHTTRGCFQVEATPCGQQAASVDLGGHSGHDHSDDPMGKATLEVSDHLTAESCYDESTESMHYSMHFHDVTMSGDGRIPWLSVGYTATEACLMNDPNGGVTPIVLVSQASGDAAPMAHKTMLLPESKSGMATAMESMYAVARPLEGEEEYHHVSVEAPMASAAVAMVRSGHSLPDDDTVSLHFMETVGAMPEAVNLMYAVGNTPELGFHGKRGCFQVKPTPCAKPEQAAVEASQGSKAATEEIQIDLDLKDMETAEARSSSASRGIFASAALALLAVVAAVIGM